MYVASLFSAWNNVEGTNAVEAAKDLGREAPIRYYLTFLRKSPKQPPWESRSQSGQAALSDGYGVAECVWYPTSQNSLPPGQYRVSSCVTRDK
jgi:hypothetical protein